MSSIIPRRYMLCPYCAYDESNVIESRDALDGRATRRRRECLRCGKRFTTYEKVGDIELRVIKRDGRIEPYRREKLERCFEKACWKLNVEERSKLVDQIEMKLLNWPLKNCRKTRTTRSCWTLSAVLTVTQWKTTRPASAETAKAVMSCAGNGCTMIMLPCSACMTLSVKCLP